MKSIRLQSTLGWALAAALASPSTAQVTFAPGPSYSIGIPSGSSISSSSTGPLYFQLSAPTTYQWVALGIGEQMSGSTIFVMYQDGNGNVTISGRSGRGEVEPRLDTSIQGGLQLLAGSGVSGGNMVANVRCTTCTLQSDATSSSSPWIAAWNTGSSLDTTSTSATLRQHANQNTRQVRIDLSGASIASDSNPFVASSTTPDSTSTNSGAPTTATSTSSRPTSSTSGNTGGVVVSSPNFNAVSDYQKAHGIIMGVVVVLLFPFGAMFVRLGGSGIAHGVLQILSVCALIVGFGLGIKLADLRDMMFNNTHTIFGLVIVILFVIQPIFGIIHHIQYKRNLARAGVSHLHIWYGRTVMILGVVNGGLGLKLAANSKNGEIAYGVVAGVVGVVYIAMALFKRKGSRASLGWRKEGNAMTQAPPSQYAATTPAADPHYGQRENVVFR